MRRTDAIGRADHFRDPHAVVPLNHHHLAPRNHLSAHQDLDRFIRGAVQVDYRSGAKTGQRLQGQLGLPKAHGERQLDVEQQVQVGGIRGSRRRCPGHGHGRD